MKHLLYLTLLLTGCAQYTQVQLDLVDQAHRGVELLAEHQDQQTVLIDQLHDLRRQRLDDAFDDDVRDRNALDPDWVIEHRRAYAATIDLLWQARLASRDADRVAADNVEAIAQLLDRLRRLLRAQRRALPLRGGS